jgi:selenocysteine lyase/cysteine desulfurase
MFEASPSKYDSIFTSNTTEAINLVTESFNRNSDPDIEPVVIGTLLEHSSNDLPWRLVPDSSLIRLSIDNEGFVNLKELDALLNEYNFQCLNGNKRIRMVAVTGASNVLGTYNDLFEISRITHRYGAQLLVDAAQMVAHRSINIEQCSIDYLAFSAHKVYAPFGAGVLVARKGLLKYNPTELEQIILSGEENPGGIAAMGKSLLFLRRIGIDLIQEEELSLTKYALQKLSQVEGLTVYGIKDPNSASINRKGGIIVFSLKGIMANDLARELAERGGIGVRYGCHCAHILIKHLIGVGPGLARFQRIIVRLFPRLRLPGIARISFGIENSEKDVDNLILVLNKIAAKSKPETNIKTRINEFVNSVSSKVYPGFQ